MLFVYEPIIMYATNVNGFWFDFATMLIPQFQIFAIFLLAGSGLCTLLFYVNKLFDRKVYLYKIVVLTGGLLYFAAYIEGNWLIGDLPLLDGSEIIWNQYGYVQDSIISVLSIIIGSIIFFGSKRYGFTKTLKYIAVISVIISAVLSITLISVVTNNDTFMKKESVGFTPNNWNNISQNENFIIFLLDAVDSGVFEKLLDNNVQYKQIFADFTYFTDAASVYGFTRDSIPQILSGYINRNETGFAEYSTNAYNNSQLFNMLNDKQYDINLYSNDIIWNGVPAFNVCNAVIAENVKLNLKPYIEQEVKYILFKYLPYRLKKYSKIEGLDFYCCRSCEDLNLSNYWIYNNVINIPALNKQPENLFQFIHADGAHVPFIYDKNVQIIEDGTYSQEIEACITMVAAYIQRLKENNAYDNSIIIILADHGYSENYTDEEILKRFNPILLIKGFYENHELIKSDTKVSYVDLPNVYHELISGKKSTNLTKQFKEDRTRFLIWYRYTKENHMTVYKTDGNMKEIESFIKTDNTYNR